MNKRSDIDRALRTWFEDGPTTMPDRVVDVVALRIGRQRQRRTWRLRGRPFMTMYAKLAAGAAAVLIVGIIGWQLLPRVGGPGGPSIATTIPSPSTVPTVAPSSGPTAAPSCDSDLAGCSGVLPAGAHRSNQLQPTLSFTIGSGWNNVLDTPTIYELVPADSTIPTGTQIFVWTSVVIGDQTPACDSVAKAGVGNTVANWITYLRSHPGLTSSKPKAVTLGTATGQEIDLSVKSTWTQACSGLPELGPVVQFILDNDPLAGGSLYGVSTRSDMHLYVLDVSGRRVLIQIYVPKDAVGLAAAMAAIQPLIDSVRFGGG